MASIEHGSIAAGLIHRIANWEYVDSTARLAATGFVPADIGKWAWQQDDNSYWLLTDDTPITWVQVTFAAGTYQPLDSDLTALAGLTATTDNMIQSVGSAWASRTPTQVKTALGLVVGTNVQAHDADLDTIAGLTATTDSFLQAKSSAWAARTPTQVTADLIAVVGDSGSGGTKGLVPAPGAGDAAAGKFLKADGTFAVPAGSGMSNPMTTQDDLIVGGASGTPARLAKGADGQVLTVDPTTHHLVWATPSGGGGSGDVVGPSSSVASEIALFDGTTGKLIKRATTTGLLKATSGVIAAAVAGTDYAAAASGLPAVPATGPNGQVLGIVSGAAAWIDEVSTVARLWDDFMGGNTTSASIGALGWQINGGGPTLATQAAEAGHPGLLRRGTGASSGNTGVLFLQNNAASGSNMLIPADNFDLIWIARLNSNDANTTIQLGLWDTGSGLASQDGIYFEKQDADTSWFAVCRIGGVQTRSAAVLATDTSFHKFRMRRKDASTISFSIDGGAEVDVTAHIPTNAIMPCAGIKNSTASTKTFDVDAFALVISGLSR